MKCRIAQLKIECVCGDDCNPIEKRDFRPHPEEVQYFEDPCLKNGNSREMHVEASRCSGSLAGVSQVFQVTTFP